ncbi:unnamed protein product [Ectocarpus sp. CCAP 1310/34]|nr:unnamed protein product [Ectocarpus sp. CCAP 1310/34]
MSRFSAERAVPEEDLNQLDDYNKATIAAHLHKRFKVQRPYTSLGNIVVAVNPFEWLDLYDDDLGLAYQEPGRRDLPAHIYKSTAAAYRALLEGQEDQSILISGVSGAGKTETAKLLLGHLASVAGSEEGGVGSERIQHMVECTVVLESFGNAVMMGNNNSSRYGVVTQLQFDDGDIPKMVGSLNTTYLLEKSRVVSRSSRERNFHVFYQMVGSDDEDFKKTLHLSGKTSNDFQYLSTHAPAEDMDFTGLAEVQDAIRELGIAIEEEKDVFKALGGLLHLGQLEFLSDTGRTDDASKLAGGTEKSLQTSADLLGLSVEELTGALLTRPLMVARETFVKPNKVGEAQSARDALAKDVYLGIFNYLLKKINEATSCTENEEAAGTISLIDIFGFESFRRNGFEQLLINYASEKLQQMFIQDVFKSVERLCETEGIDHAKFMYRDNTTILETLEGNRGVLSMLDEECLLPHGTDSGFVALLQAQTQVAHEQHLKANSRLKHFTVHHYNHAVKYDADGFVERNRDKLHTSVAKLLGASTNNMVRRVYAYAVGGGEGADEGESSQPAQNDFQARLAMFKKKETGPAGGGARKGKRVSSVMEGGQEVLKRESMGRRFKGELRDLVERIHSTEVQYILCIRPNMENDPVLFEDEYVTQQLLSASIVEAAQVYKFVGVNVSHLEFIKRYGRLGPRELTASGRPGDAESEAVVCTKLADVLLIRDRHDPDSKTKFEVGRTKIFIRGAEHEHLEEVMAFYERRSSRKIIRHWRVRRARIRKAEAEAARRERAAAREKARQESALRVVVDDDEDDRSSDAAPVSPIRAEMDKDDEEEDEEEEEEEELPYWQGGQASPSDARVGANLSAPRTEPFTKATMRAFLNQPVETGVIECMIRRKKGVMSTIYQAYYEPSMKLLMTAKKDKGRYIIAMNPEYMKKGEPSTLGKVKAVAQRRQYIVYDNGFKANKTLPEKYTIKPERKEIAAVSIDLTRHDDFQGPRKLEVLVADSDDDLVDHASLLNSFGNDNTNIITPVPRMHSIKPEWDEDAGYFVLEFYKDRIKKQSVKNFMLHNSRGQFIMQFGRAKEDNVFALDFTGPFSPLAAFGVALSGCDSSV